MPQKIVPIDRSPVSEKATKTVAANQKAVDGLPLKSGTWRVAGVPGLYLRCRAQSKSYYVQRKVAGRLVRESSDCHEASCKPGPLPLSAAFGA